MPNKEIKLTPEQEAELTDGRDEKGEKDDAQQTD